MFSNDHRDLQHLLSGLCDGQLTEFEFARLEQMLQRNSACRRQYLEYMDLHCALSASTRRSGFTPKRTATVAGGDGAAEVPSHVNCTTRYTTDEIRAGTTWSSGIAAWSVANSSGEKGL